MKSSSGPPSHSPRRAASCTRHGLTSRPVNRTCQGVGTGARWVDRGTGAAGPAWLVVREPRGRPAEAIPRTRRPRSRTRRRPRALFWVGVADSEHLGEWNNSFCLCFPTSATNQVVSSQPAQYIATALSSLMLMWCKLLQMLLPIISRSECSCMTDLHRSCSWLSSSTCSGLGPGLGSGCSDQG